MLTGGQKFQKTVKTKYKKTKDGYDSQDGREKEKSRHHDKSFYRLLKQEKQDNEDYAV